MNAQFKEIKEMIIKVAISNLQKEKYLMPVALLFKEDHIYKIIGMGFSKADEKQAVANKIKTTIKEDEADAVIFVMESWITHVHSSDIAAIRQAQKEGLSNNPDRKEAIIIQVSSKDENETTIIRFERKGELISIGETETNNEFTLLESRWSDGLWGTKTLH